MNKRSQIYFNRNNPEYYKRKELRFLRRKLRVQDKKIDALHRKIWPQDYR